MKRTIHCPKCEHAIVLDVLQPEPQIRLLEAKEPRAPRMALEERIERLLTLHYARGVTVRDIQQRTGARAATIVDTLGRWLEAYDVNGNYDPTASVVITVRRGRAIYYVLRSLADAADVRAFVGDVSTSTADSN